MTQGETITTALGDGAAHLTECSNSAPTHRYPRLTMMLPRRPAYLSDAGVLIAPEEPAASLQLSENAVHQLYALLRGYYET